MHVCALRWCKFVAVCSCAVALLRNVCESRTLLCCTFPLARSSSATNATSSFGCRSGTSSFGSHRGSALSPPTERPRLLHGPRIATVFASGQCSSQYVTEQVWHRCNSGTSSFSVAQGAFSAVASGQVFKAVRTKTGVAPVPSFWSHRGQRTSAVTRVPTHDDGNRFHQKDLKRTLSVTWSSVKSFHFHTLSGTEKCRSRSGECWVSIWQLSILA